MSAVIRTAQGGFFPSPHPAFPFPAPDISSRLISANVGLREQNQTAVSSVPSPVPAAKWVGIQRTRGLICAL